MFARGTRMRQALRSTLALIGLFLMIASFVWMQRTSKPQPARLKMAQPSPTLGPFAFVVVDPGHGGQDSVAMYGGVLEKDLTLVVAHHADGLLDSEEIMT